MSGNCFGISGVLIFSLLFSPKWMKTNYFVDIPSGDKKRQKHLVEVEFNLFFLHLDMEKN
jgi:hypothetical protein